MSQIKFENILSFSSEDPEFKAENLLTGVNKWKGLGSDETRQSVTIKVSH